MWERFALRQGESGVLRKTSPSMHFWCCALSESPLEAPTPQPDGALPTGQKRTSGRSSGVEHNLAKVGVEGSNPFARSSFDYHLIVEFGLGSSLRGNLTARFAIAVPCP